MYLYFPQIKKKKNLMEKITFAITYQPIVNNTWVIRHYS